MNIATILGKAVIALFVLALIGGAVFFGLVTLDSRYDIWGDGQTTQNVPNEAYSQIDMIPYLGQIRQIDESVKSLEVKKLTIDEEISKLKNDRAEIVKEIRDTLKEIESQIGE